jgi:hypothetical protein
VILALLACGPERAPKPRPEPVAPTATLSPTTQPPTVLSAASVSPDVVDPLGGSHLVLRGEGFGDGLAVEIGGVPAAVQVRSDTEADVVSGAIGAADGLDLVVTRGGAEVRLAGAIDAWSPAELPGARVFDAAVGVQTAGADEGYEWQRLTADVGPGWRARDGNTTTWLPSTGRFWMVAGWNPYEQPQGFASGPPETLDPNESTTDEVWSSADGVTWRQDLPHLHGQFEPRHSHNTRVWNGALWSIGGDHHQGFYNHDVITSADGVAWTVVLGPGAPAGEPPWSERVLQASGTYDGDLWMVGGQDAEGDPAEYTYHNDVWRSSDGVTWTEVVPDAPASDTRWAGCGVVDGLVEFRGELWLVGCARERSDAVGHSMSNEVWSTTDGAVWRRHAEPPWVGKIWHNVVVWDDRLWAMFGFTYGDPANGWPIGNANEVWYSDDGETWTSLPPDAPVPGSHAQGVAVTDDFLLLAGGNYTFGFGAGEDRSTWRLVPFRGERVASWQDRAAGLVVAGSGEERPLLVPDAFGAGRPGVWFDGSSDVLSLPDSDLQPSGRTVLWVARSPFLPPPYEGWDETYAPVGTIVGGTDATGSPSSSVGLSGGRVVLANRQDAVGAYGEPLWTRVEGGSGLQEGPGSVHVAGLTHAPDGTVRTWVDGVAAGEGTADWGVGRSWRQLGGGMDGPYYGPNSRFAGTIGAVVVAPAVLSDTELARIAAWAEGRFGAAR